MELLFSKDTPKGRVQFYQSTSELMAHWVEGDLWVNGSDIETCMMRLFKVEEFLINAVTTQDVPMVRM